VKPGCDKCKNSGTPWKNLLIPYLEKGIVQVIWGTDQMVLTRLWGMEKRLLILPLPTFSTKEMVLVEHPI
jgi:hypothetical protein